MKDCKIWASSVGVILDELHHALDVKKIRLNEVNIDQYLHGYWQALEDVHREVKELRIEVLKNEHREAD